MAAKPSLFPNFLADFRFAHMPSFGIINIGILVPELNLWKTGEGINYCLKLVLFNLGKQNVQCFHHRCSRYSHPFIWEMTWCGLNDRHRQRTFTYF